MYAVVQGSFTYLFRGRRGNFLATFLAASLVNRLVNVLRGTLRRNQKFRFLQPWILFYIFDYVNQHLPLLYMHHYFCTAFYSSSFALVVCHKYWSARFALQCYLHHCWVTARDVHGNGIPNGTGNPMGMGIKHRIWNGREWETTSVGMGITCTPMGIYSQRFYAAMSLLSY